MARRRTRPRRGPAAPEIDGHRVVGPLGFGANGPAWLARSAEGEDVVVSVLPLPAGPAGRSRLRRLAALRHGSHPHVARVRQVVAMDGGRCAVVSDRVRGPSLDTVVRARGSLTDAELYGLLHALAGGLAHLHARGVIHGDVAPGNVVLDDGGMPVLVDLAGEVTHELGTEGFVAPERHRGAPATPAGDVWALARVVQWAAGSAPPRDLIDRLGEALRAAPQRRPTARGLREIAAAAGEHRPLTMPSAATLAQTRMRAPEAVTRRRPTDRAAAGTAARRAGRRPRPWDVLTGRRQRRRASRASVTRTGVGRSLRHAARGTGRSGARRRRLLAGVAVAVGLAVGGAVVGPWLWPVSQGLDPARAAVVLDELLTRRDGALMAQDGAALARLNVPGGDHARSDEALLAALQTSGTRLTELMTSVAQVRRVHEVAGGTAVDAVLVQGAHARIVDDARHELPAPPPECSRIVLAATSGDTWQLLRTEPCD